MIKDLARTALAKVGIGRQPAPQSKSARVQNAYLRDNKSGIIASRPSSIREHRDDVRRSWDRAAGLAVDLIQNSGRLKGAVDQIIADTVGNELTCNPMPDVSKLGYSDKERRDFIALIKKRWKMWAWNPRECDVRGKFTIPQQATIGIRYFFPYGESLGMVEYFDEAKRKRYNLRTGNKFLMVPPYRLVRDTNEAEGLFHGVYHDENGRVTHYKFLERMAGIERKRDYAAHDAEGRPLVMHAFDPKCATDVRGISEIAPGIRKYLMAENLDEATAQVAFLQTILAVSLVSDQISADAFEALEALKEAGAEDVEQIATNFANFFNGKLAGASDRIELGSDPQVNHLSPGEKLLMETAKIPGSEYLPFSKSLAREMARTFGVTYGGLTMDYADATYSSVRMETSCLWPVVQRRREYIAAPHYQLPYEHWLEEEIATGRIPLKGGYRAFQANRDAILWCSWQGPAKPTADDGKSAKASSEKIINGTTSLAQECAELGLDPDEVFEQRVMEHQRYVEAGMRSPFDMGKGSDPANQDDEPKKKKVA